MDKRKLPYLFTYLWYWYISAAVRQSKEHDEKRRCMARKMRESFDESSYCDVEMIKSLASLKAGNKPQQPSTQQSVWRLTRIVYNSNNQQQA